MIKMNLNNQFRKKIAYMMEIKKWTIAELARKCKVTRRSLSRIINIDGVYKRKFVSINDVYMLSRAFAVDAGRLAFEPIETFIEHFMDRHTDWTLINRDIVEITNEMFVDGRDLGRYENIRNDLTDDQLKYLKKRYHRAYVELNTFHQKYMY